MRKFKVKVKSVQEVEFEVTDEAYVENELELTAERIIEIEEDNVKSDPTYFSFLDDATEHVTVDVEEIKDDQI